MEGVCGWVCVGMFENYRYVDSDEKNKLRLRRGSSVEFSNSITPFELCWKICILTYILWFGIEIARFRFVYLFCYNNCSLSVASLVQLRLLSRSVGIACLEEGTEASRLRSLISLMSTYLGSKSKPTVFSANYRVDIFNSIAHSIR